MVLSIKETDSTPYVDLNFETCNLLVKGRSLPENVADFYEPIKDFITSNLKEFDGSAVFEFHMEYFNTASSKMFLDIFQIIEEEEKDILIKWHYFEDDDDMKDAGEEYADIMEGLSFEHIAIPCD